MDQENLKMSLEDYESQIFQVNEALKVTPIGEEFDSLSTLQSDLQELIDLTKESLEAVAAKKIQNSKIEQNNVSNLENGDKNAKYNDALVDEYALFMAEMADTGAFEDKDKTQNDGSDVAEHKEEQTPVDIEEELSSLEGMKCSAMHCHKWGGAPSLHNAMVCSVVRDHEDNTNFYSLKVRVMFTNPTHKEMVPCPFYLDGECKFTDEQCRYSHGEVVPLSSLSEAVDPNFSLLKPGCRVLAKLQQTDEPSSSKSSEKYLLWHRAVVKTVDSEKNACEIKLEHESGMKNEGKNYHTVEFSNVFPLTGDDLDSDSDSDSSSPDLTYPYHDDATSLPGTSSMNTDIVDRALTHTPGAARLGDWEKHTKGIGSKLLLSMGYVFGGGLGPAGNGIVEPVPCTIKPKGRSLDHCMRISECNNDDADPFKAEKKLLRLQKKQEEKEKKAYERAQDRERHNVFNVLNSVFASNSASSSGTTNSNSNFPPHKKANKMSDIKSSTCKNLNIENFKITEELIRLEKDISKLQSSLSRNEKGSDVYKSIVLKLALKSKELEDLKKVQSKVADEQSLRKDKRKLTVF